MGKPTTSIPLILGPGWLSTAADPLGLKSKLRAGFSTYETSVIHQQPLWVKNSKKKNGK